MSSHKRLLLGLRELEERLNSNDTRFSANLATMLEELKAIKLQLDDLRQELKAKAVENASNGPLALTTGPVIRSDLVSNLYVEVLNNTDGPQTVRVTLFDLAQVPKQHIEHRLVTIHSKHAASEVFEIGPEGLNLRKFEVQVESLEMARHGIYVYIAGVQGLDYQIIQSNVFRHQQLVSLE